jgi:KUP system potassium uptake protein
MAATSDSGIAGSDHAPGVAAHPRVLVLALGSLAWFFGDIGTSPIYAFRIAAATALGEEGLPDRATILGVLSLILWALIIIVALNTW